MRKNILVIIVIFSIIFLIPKNVYADVVSVNSYEELKSLLSSNNDAKLESNIEASENLLVNRNIVIDLNGHTLNMNDKTLVSYATVTIKDTSTNKLGKLTSNKSFVVQIGNSTITGELILDSGTIENNNYYGVRNLGTLTINGGAIKASSYAVYNQGNTTINDGLVYASDLLAFQNHINSTLIMNGGTIKTDADYQALNLYGNCTATINDGQILAPTHGTSHNGNGIGAFKNTELTINGGLISSYGTAIMGNGSDSSSGASEGTNAKFNINGGKIISVAGAGIYAPQINGVTTITGGEISGTTGIEIRAGKLNITGGVITATSDLYEVTGNTNGLTTTGAAISIVQHVTKQPIDTYICSGTFNGKVSYSQANPLFNEQSAIEKINMLIDEPCGKLEFNSTDPEKTIYSENFTKFIKGGIYTTSVDKYWADGYSEKYTNGKKEVIKKYKIIIEDSSKEFIKVSENESLSDNKIKITPVNRKMYKYNIKVVDTNGNEIQINNNEFIMPNSDVTISIVYTYINNPPTFDNIIYYILILGVSLVGLILILIFKRTHKNK